MKKLMFAVSALSALALGTVTRASYADCQGAGDVAVTTVARTFTAGSSWQIFVSRSPCEGLALNSVMFQPAGGALTSVLNRATIAEVHVPYDNNQVRFLDVTEQQGLGVSAIPLSAAECPGGTLFDGNRVCVMNEDHGYGWKFNTRFRSKESVVIFMASQVGSYTYINRWTFHDDGTIEPEVGLTGWLQIHSNDPADLPFGTRTNNESDPIPEIQINHMHNFYYRLDFDIGGAISDAVGRYAYNPTTSAPGCATPGACGTTTLTTITTETAQTWSAAEQTSWLVYDKNIRNSDGRRIGYELRPRTGGIWRGMVNNGEPWTNGDLWVTKFNDCEIFAANNTAPHFDPSFNCGTPAANLAAMVNGANVDGTNLVVWYVTRLHHVTRDEDQLNMPTEWVGFDLEPRSFAASNPAP